MSEPDNDRGTAAPILAALAVVSVILIAIVAFTVFGGDGLSEQERVGRAAVAQNDALQRESYADFRGYTCAAQTGTETAVLERQRASAANRGARFVDDVTNVVLDGDRATATVVYHFEKADADKINTPMTFVREAGSWKVCSPGAE